ncbi:MAG: hypothetical protein GW763_18095 [Paraglaciecola sp.]|nr:hypothetical protein [Paraglaciecola sp.]
MKYFKLLLATSLMLVLTSCLSLDVAIKENHFRFENFRHDYGDMIGSQGDNIEYVYLMCFRKSLTSWDYPKQYPSGEHDLWVRAYVSERDIERSQKEAIVNFKVNLAAGKSYMLNRKRDGDNMAIWIQEVDSGLEVSEVKTTTLMPIPIIEGTRLKTLNEKNSLCQSSTV